MDKIEIWLSSIFTNEKDYYKVKDIGDIISAGNNISPENIFLILGKKGLIGYNKENLRLYKEELESGLRPSINSFKFILSEKGKEVLNNLKAKELLECKQLKLDL